jgi:pyruvate formate lyase activating enzyme
MELLQGTVASVQRCSVHDGPGIRSVIFLKGCPLRCKWCHNPETIRFEPETVYHPERCIHCGHCDEGCFSGARVLCGETMDVSAAASLALADQAYYGKDGGVTVSGGEPTAQSRFVSALLQEMRAKGVHTRWKPACSAPGKRSRP